MPRAPALPLGLLLAVVACAAGARTAHAQVVRGTILEESRQVPVPDAAVYLLDRAGARVASALADDGGHYALTVPARGEYLLRVERLGYQSLVTPLLEIGVERGYELDLLVRPEPIAIEPLDVEVGARRGADLARRIVGADPVALGGKVVVGKELEALKVPARSMVDVIRSAQLGGTVTSGIHEFCLRMRGGCANVYYDGIRIPQDDVESIDTSIVTAIVLLRQHEAATIFGTLPSGAGTGGTLMIFTRAYYQGR